MYFKSLANCVTMHSNVYRATVLSFLAAQTTVLIIICVFVLWQGSRFRKTMVHVSSSVTEGTKPLIQAAQRFFDTSSVAVRALVQPARSDKGEQD